MEDPKIQQLISTIGNKAGTLRDLGYHKPRTRKLVNFHPAGGWEVWGVHNNSKQNIERALVERVLTVAGDGGERILPPQPAPGAVSRILKEFRRKLIHSVGRVPVMTTEQFVDTYSGRKRRMYQNASDDLLLRPVQRSDAIVSAFIKDEKTNLSRKCDPCPRIIQPRGIRFNAEIGKYLKPMEKRIFHSIGRIFGGTTFMKGLNAFDRGQVFADNWGSLRDPVCVCLDASRFDQHCSKQVIMWEHDLFEKITVDRPGLKRLNSFRRTNTCYARCSGGGFKYVLQGTRMSGDMDTALGNCTTMCAMTWSFMTHIGVHVFRYANDGDDGVIFIERENLKLVLDNYLEFFLKLGFTMKLEGVFHELEQVEFCQSKPVFDGMRWRMVRDPAICLGKDSLSLKGEIRPEK